MFPRSQRLSQSRAIVSVMKRGYTVTHDALRFRFFPSTRSTAKIAVVVSLRVSKRAVIRNR
ncbi:MAG: ribonuclease P protein component, partial [Candidatus Yonathbacteria bacterium]|nr:ribonuclease P protein component [Candidatus Yonathbacteria bacterium]